MRPPGAPLRLVRFGLFELDLATGELRKKGVKVALQEQPFQVLATLVAQAGELVTREELRQKLWADAVFVDFDHGLNKAVAKIRRALGDLAESPRFVETLERRGYRFIAPVEPVAGATIPVSTARPGARSTLIARLVVDDRVIPLACGTHEIGRDPSCTVWIDSTVVSRRHARLIVTEAVITLEDLGSRNGTYVNGERIERVRHLSDGDAIRIGPAAMILHTTGDDSTTLQSD